MIDRQGIEPEQLPGLGWIWIHEVGKENIYFQYEDQGRIREGFCKVDGFQYQGGGSCAQ